MGLTSRHIVGLFRNSTTQIWHKTPLTEYDLTYSARNDGTGLVLHEF
jgi:hypothetical protein